MSVVLSVLVRICKGCFCLRFDIFNILQKDLCRKHRLSYTVFPLNPLALLDLNQEVPMVNARLKPRQRSIQARAYYRCIFPGTRWWNLWSRSRLSYYYFNVPPSGRDPTPIPIYSRLFSKKGPRYFCSMFKSRSRTTNLRVKCSTAS